MFKFPILLIDNYLLKSTFTSNNKPTNDLNLKKKFEIFILNRFFTNHASISLFHKLTNMFKEGTITLNVEEIFERFTIVNKDFNLTKSQVYLIFSKNFKIESNEINLEEFINYFVDKISIRISAEDFVKTTLEELIVIYKHLEEKLMKMFLKEDPEGTNMISFKSFEKIMKILMSQDSRNEFKTIAYFK